MRAFLPAVLTTALVAFVAPTGAHAGNCLPTGGRLFELASDMVQWSITLAAGSECIQGLRHGGMLIDAVKLASPPKHGSLTIQGPSFRYRPHPGFTGSDGFAIAIFGSRLRIPGNSIIEVDVTVR